MHRSEREFANFLESQSKTYISQPKPFKYNGKSYRPDFYCPEDDIYYEVKTHLNIEGAIRLVEFKKFHPHIKFKVVSSNGYPYYSRSSGKCLKIIERKLAILKSKDILEISLDEFYENVREFHIYEKNKDGNNLKNFRARIEIMEEIDKAKEKLGMK